MHPRRAAALGWMPVDTVPATLPELKVNAGVPPGARPGERDEDRARKPAAGTLTVRVKRYHEPFGARGLVFEDVLQPQCVVCSPCLKHLWLVHRDAVHLVMRVTKRVARDSAVGVATGVPRGTPMGV